MGQDYLVLSISIPSYTVCCRIRYATLRHATLRYANFDLHHHHFNTLNVLPDQNSETIDAYVDRH